MRLAPRRIVEVLLAAGGGPLSNNEVAEPAGIDLNINTFRNAMADLWTQDIVVDGSQELKLSDELVQAVGRLVFSFSTDRISPQRSSALAGAYPSEFIGHGIVTGAGGGTFCRPIIVQ